MPDLKESLQSLTSQTFSLTDIEDMFFGAIIGGVVDDENLLKIKYEYCVSDDGRILHGILQHLVEIGQPVDYLTVFTEFARHRGSPVAKNILNRMISSVPSGFDVQKNAEILEESFIRRNVVSILDFVKLKVQESPHLASELLYDAFERINKLTEAKVEFDLSKEITKTADDILAGNVSQLVIPTGIKSIDEAIGGYSTQEITVIGGRPGHGKTTSAVNLCIEALKKNPDLKVVLFQLEMGKEAVKRKFISALGGVRSFDMRTGKEVDATKIKQAVDELMKFEGRFFLYDNIYDLNTMNKIIRTTGARLVFVDFLTLMDEAQVEDIRRALGKVAIKAKRFAKTHNMAYVFYSQLNRGPDTRDNHKPMLADLAESDLVGQLASEVWLLYFRYKYSNDPSDENKLFVVYDKARYAKVTDILLYFDPNLIILRDPNKLSIPGR
jgi:replicative DNA helicase